MRGNSAWALAITAATFALVAPAVRAHELTDLGHVSGFAEATAFDINKNGQVVGFAYNHGSIYHAFVWDAVNGMQDLGTLPGYGMGIARGINDQGWVVGNAWVFGQENYVGWFWSLQTGMFALPPLPGYSASVAYKINN